MKEIMTKYKKPLLIGVLCLIALVILAGFPESTFAQPGLPNSPEQTPIDGGLGILAALGGAYAIKKLRDKNDV